MNDLKQVIHFESVLPDGKPFAARRAYGEKVDGFARRYELSGRTVRVKLWQYQGRCRHISGHIARLLNETALLNGSGDKA